MNIHARLHHVGPLDPQLKNSIVVEQHDELFDPFVKLTDDNAVCYFNGEHFAHGDVICSGKDKVFRCEKGKWIRQKSVPA